MAKDAFHEQVKNALIKDGWKITNDPLIIRISEAVKVQIYLAAETAIAERLVELGVPRDAIVIGFHSPFKRQFTSYAVF